MKKKLFSLIFLVSNLFAKSHFADSTSFPIDDIAVVSGALLVGIAAFWSIRGGLKLAGHDYFVSRRKAEEEMQKDLQKMIDYETKIHVEIEEDVLKIEELIKKRKELMKEHRVIEYINKSQAHEWESCNLQTTHFEEIVDYSSELEEINKEIEDIYSNSSCPEVLLEFKNYPDFL